MKKIKSGLIELDQFLESGIPIGDLSKTILSSSKSGSRKPHFIMTVYFDNFTKTNEPQKEK